jgi:hypothetical protein
MSLRELGTPAILFHQAKKMKLGNSSSELLVCIPQGLALLARSTKECSEEVLLDVQMKNANSVPADTAQALCWGGCVWGQTTPRSQRSDCGGKLDITEFTQVSNLISISWVQNSV